MIRRLKLRTVVDVGANRGQFALLCLGISREIRIISFEPASRAFQMLRTVTAGGRVQAIQAAIAEVAGEFSLNITVDDDSSSFLSIGARQMALFGTRVDRQERVRAAPLPTFLAPEEIVAPALLKIDVQGSELSVIRGCSDLLHKFAWVYVECSFVELYDGQALIGEVIESLAARGFRLAGVFNQVSGDAEPAVQADMLFVAGTEVGP